MPNPMVGLIGASVGSGVAQASAAKSAASKSRKAADQATQLQRDTFNQTTANFRPFLGAGRDALSAYLYELGLGERPTVGATRPGIESTRDGFAVGGKTFSTLAEAEAEAERATTGGTLYGGYEMTPAARYLLEQGTDQIQGAAAASGGLFSGASLKALEDNRRRVVSADTADYFNRILGVAGMGQAAAGGQASAGQAMAGNIGNIAQSSAAQQGAVSMAGANAFSGMLGDMAGIYGYLQNPMAKFAGSTLAPTTSIRPPPNPFYGAP